MRRALVLALILLCLSLPALAQDSLIEIRSIKTRVTEQNNVYVQVAWQLELANKAGRPVVVAADIEFQDADGFIVTRRYEGDLVLGTNETKTFTGVHLVRTENLSKIAKVVAKTRVRP